MTSWLAKLGLAPWLAALRGQSRGFGGTPGGGGQKQAADQLFWNDMPARVYAIGDVHGCYDLYADLEARIADLVAKTAPAAQETALVVLLGDMIDRGPQSAQMLDHLLAPAPRGLQRIILRGNHEAMFLRFWAAPRLNDPWLSHGGAQMLASYGVDIGNGQLGRPDRLRHALDASIPQDHVAFLASLPLALHMPNYVFAHAGINPNRPLAAQQVNDLLWGDPEQLDRAELIGGQDLGITVVHGHRPAPDGQAVLTQRRINVDTGAYATGRLTAVEILNGRPTRFVVAQKGNNS